MELVINTPTLELPFIEANTIESSLMEIQDQHIIPVFNRDNIPLISQSQFIETAYDAIQSIEKTNLLGPFVRVSHPVKGRIPSARHKKAVDLKDHEMTLYYERMMFCFVVPSIREQVNGRELKLVIGGIKAYNQDNLTRHSSQHFQFFIGYQVKVCSNLCIWTDGTNMKIKTDNIDTLGDEIRRTILEFNPKRKLTQLSEWRNVGLTEAEFAHVIGRARMSLYTEAPPLGLTDTQLNTVVKGYYQDEHFGGNDGIDLWSLYNLLTAANKTSYIDSFASRAITSTSFVASLYDALTTGADNWYLWKS
jgi:hypothetical protein